MGDIVRVAFAFGLSLHVLDHLQVVGLSEESLQDQPDLLRRELVWRQILFQHSSVSAETVSAGVAGQLGFLLLQLI